VPNFFEWVVFGCHKSVNLSFMAVNTNEDILRVDNYDVVNRTCIQKRFLVAEKVVIYLTVRDSSLFSNSFWHNVVIKLFGESLTSLQKRLI
jgi:hypothetical protein